MKKSNWLSYFRKIIWFVGLIILSNISIYFANYVKQIANDTFTFIPLLWTHSFISLIFGIYVSLIFVKKWSFKINHSLLWCVSIPCLLISFCYPIISILSPIEGISFSFIPNWLIRITSLEVFGIIAGMTFILSIFNTQSKK